MRVKSYVGCPRCGGLFLRKDAKGAEHFACGHVFSEEEMAARKKYLQKTATGPLEKTPWNDGGQ